MASDDTRGDEPPANADDGSVTELTARWRWLATRLDVDVASLCEHTRPLAGVDFVIAAAAVGELVDAHATAVTGADGDEAATWATLPRGDAPAARYPVSLLAVLPAGTLADFPVAVGVRPSGEGHDVAVVAGGDHGRRAVDVLDHLIARVPADAAHPYRGRVLAIGVDSGQLTADVVAAPADGRDGLILPREVWDDIDVSVTRAVARADELQRAGLGRDRGVLLAGATGTGKTALVRVLTAELAGGATVLWVDPSASGSVIGEAYRLAAALAPALVALEDVDVVAGRDRRGSPRALAELLAAIDGVATTQAGVITVATTGDAGRLDESLTRAGRLDRTIQLSHPSLDERRRILAHHLDELGDGLDVDRLASVTEGASGAELREIVRHAVLSADDAITTDLLLQSARERGHGPSERTGQYL